MKKLILLFLIGLFTFSASAQKRGRYKYKNKRNQHFSKRMVDPIYSVSQSPCKPWGLHTSLGATYTFTDLNPEEYSVGSDTLTTYKHDPSGRIGYYFDIGLLHIFKKRNPVVHYFDWALGLKHFAGKEEFKGETVDVPNNTSLLSRYGKGKWDNGYVFIRANIHNVIQIGKWNFIDNSIGVNADYQIYGYKHNTQWEGDNIPTNPHTQARFLASLHYRFGFGIKLKEGMFLVPFAKIPLMNFYEWNQGKPTIRWFDSWYMPIIVGVKFAILWKKDPNACPPVYTNPSDQDKSDQFQNQ